MTLYDFLASLWRTVVPLLVGTLVAWASHAGLHVDSAAATAWLTAAFSGVYYALFRLAEQHLGSAWGWALGLARPPAYTKPAPTAPEVSTTTSPAPGA